MEERGETRGIVAAISVSGAIADGAIQMLTRKLTAIMPAVALSVVMMRNGGITKRYPTRFTKRG